MNIPQGYEVKSSPAGSDTPPEIYAPGSDGPIMSFVYLDEFSALPSRDSVLLSVGSGYHNDPQLREDIREFGGRPAIAVQARTFADTYALISLSAEIGGSFWTFNFFGVDLGETEQLLRQASDSLTKQQ
ncbi:hypothetical protein EII12_08965 [Buchananella hordeovulneris]|nr:hypothetical protein EII12_08965 [Buchananella hordeovulneris]